MQISRRFSSSTFVKRVLGGGGRSFGTATAASSDAQPTVRRRSRIPKAERKAMVESYVNNYRAMNKGKFPTVSDAQREVGGCYYVIKNFVEEIEYQSRMSTTSRRDEKLQEKDINKGSESAMNTEVCSTKMAISDDILQDAQTRDRTLLEKEATSDIKSLPDLERAPSSQLAVDTETHDSSQKGKKKVSRAQMTLDTQICKDAGIERETQASLETEASNKSKSSSAAEKVLLRQTEINEGIRKNDQSTAINYVESDLPKANDRALLDDMPRPSNTAGTTEAIKVKRSPVKKPAVGFSSSSENAANNVKEKSANGDMLEVDKVKSETEPRQAEKSKTHTRELSEEHGDDTQPQRKSFMWENLKSLANGIANIWRKL